MDLTGQAALRSPAFSQRLSALLEELQRFGCTVWLEGMTLRFDVPERQLGWVQAGGVGELLGRYHDVVVWLPEAAQDHTGLQKPHTTPASVTAETRTLSNAHEEAVQPHHQPLRITRPFAKWFIPKAKRMQGGSGARE